MNTKTNILFAAGVFLLMQGMLASGVSAGVCTPYATRQCVSDVAYWYDSCGSIHAVYQNCNLAGQACQNGICVLKQPSYSAYYAKKCYNNNVYWYDSKGVVSGLYKNCSDNNSCTADSCSGLACANTLTCDGSTCAVGSADYQQYCSGAIQNQNQSQVQVQGESLAISLFAAKESSAGQLEKYLTASHNDFITIFMFVKNNSVKPLDNVLVQADIGSAIDYTGNLKIDNTDAAGNIASGINLGTVAPEMSKAVTLRGKVNAPDRQAVVQINGRATAGAVSDSDVLVINAQPAQSNLTAATSSTTALMDFVKKWFLWIVVIAILAALFIIIFRRLSANV